MAKLVQVGSSWVKLGKEDALNTLDSRSAERRELLGEILRIAELHDRAEKFIRRSASVFQTDVSKRKIIDSA